MVNAAEFLNFKLQDDATENGGIAFIGETLNDFIDGCDSLTPDSPMDEVNKALIECGIKPIPILDPEFIKKNYLRPITFNFENNDDITGYAVDMRINADDVPQGWHKYDIRHLDDDDMEMATIEPRVFCNFHSTLLTKEALVFPEKGYFDITTWTWND